MEYTNPLLDLLLKDTRPSLALFKKAFSKTGMNYQNKQGYTPLHYVCAKGYLDLLGELILQGAHLELQNQDGKRALHLAIENNHTACVQKLLEQGVDANARNTQGQSPLFSCFPHYDNVRTLQLLIQHGADPHTTDLDGNTLLHGSVFMHAHSCLDHLISIGLDINAQTTEYLETPLHVAISSRNFKAAHAFIEAKANAALPNSFNETAFKQLETLFLAEKHFARQLEEGDLENQMFNLYTSLERLELDMATQGIITETPIRAIRGRRL